jgi:predicted ribosome quality control (RQC) complex YloA/Tae2 family protein
MKIEIIHFSNIKSSITYYIGKSKLDNFNLINISNPNDLWFHANNTSSCHVVAKIPEEENEILTKKQIMTIIKKAALLCKQNTNKLYQEKNIEIIYTLVKNITKTDKNGTVIANNIKTYTLFE